MIKKFEKYRKKTRVFKKKTQQNEIDFTKSLKTCRNLFTI